jgi:hypothetical protein
MARDESRWNASEDFIAGFRFTVGWVPRPLELGSLKGADFYVLVRSSHFFLSGHATCPPCRGML